MAQYGLVSDVETAKQELRNMNRDYNARRTWSGLETNLALSAQAANAQLKRDYSTAMSDAYNTAKLQKRSIDASGILGQEGAVLRQQNQAALEQAYATYTQNLSSGQQGIIKDYQEGMQSIDNALTQEAQYYTDYADKHYDYLEYLFYQYSLGNNKLFDEKNWNKYLVEDTDENGDTFTRLKTREELFSPSFNELEDEEGNKYKEWTGLIDDEGNLTLSGVDFYDQLENELLGKKYNVDGELIFDDATFGQFLAQTNVDFLMDQYGYTRSEAEKVAAYNSELLDWSQSYNPYDFTIDGTKKGTFKTMNGRVSTDYTYSFAERFGGMSREQIDGLFKEYNDAAVAISEKMKKAKDKGHSITNEVSNLVDSLHNMAKDLGIDNDPELKLDWDKLKSLALQYHAGTMTSGEMAGQWFGDVGTLAVTGLTSGGVVGGLAGAGAGPLMLMTALMGAVIGGIGGSILGIVQGSLDVDISRQQNEDMAKQSQELFNNALGAMTTYVAQKRRQAEIDFMVQNS